MELTVEGFFEGDYQRLRKRSKEFAVSDDVSRIKNYYLRAFGSQPLAWVASDDGKRAHIEWLSELPARRSKRDKEPLAPSTLWNTYYAVKGLLDLEVDLQHLARHQFQPPFDAAKYLPEKGDKNPEWRESAYLEIDDVVALTSDQRLPLRRRLSNSIDLMTGGRCGEVATCGSATGPNISRVSLAASLSCALADQLA